MDKKIHEIVDLVLKINKMGNNLALKLENVSINIYDLNNGCKGLPIGKGGYLYSEKWNDKFNVEIEEAIQFLKEFMEDN